MAYRWKANRDSGCVRSHRNPDTKRRWARGERMINSLSKTYRAYERNVMDAAMPALKTGGYDVAISRLVRTGWDIGDPFMGGKVGEVAIEVTPDPEPEYPPIPEEAWDFAADPSRW